MTEEKSVRLCALAGLAFVILIIVSGPILQGSSPSVTDSAAKIYHYIATHVGDLKASAALAAFAMAAVLVWLAAHFSSLRKAEGGRSGFAVAALGGGILATAATVVQSAIQATTALRVHNLGPSGAQFFYTLYQFLTGALLVGLAILVGASALVFLRSGLHARWFGYVSAVLAVVNLVGIVGVGYTNGAAQGFMGIGVALSGIWILAISIILLRKPERAIA
ncbi:MAG TPA: hypothetical protein VI462_09360 [Acidimicrobiia bacterium]